MYFTKREGVCNINIEFTMTAVCIVIDFFTETFL